MDLALIQAHHGVEETVKRHLPFWRAVSRRVVFVTRVDAKLELEVEQIAIGTGGHHGQELAERIVGMFDWASKESWTTFGLFEYDAISLSMLAPPLEGMAALRYRQDRPDYWVGKFFLHYPHVYSRKAFDKIHPQLKEILSQKVIDTRYSDRFIGLAAERAGVPIMDLRAEKIGFSRDTITELDRSELIKAVRKGASFFHGIKDADTLKALIKEYAKTSKPK